MKHASHCLRLLKMGNEILRGEGVQVYRHSDKQYLRHIREGNVPYEAILHEAEQLEQLLDESYNNSKLPHSVDKKAIDSLLIEMVDEAHGME